MDAPPPAPNQTPPMQTPTPNVAPAQANFTPPAPQERDTNVFRQRLNQTMSIFGCPIDDDDLNSDWPNLDLLNYTALMIEEVKKKNDEEVERLQDHLEERNNFIDELSDQLEKAKQAMTKLEAEKADLIAKLDAKEKRVVELDAMVIDLLKNSPPAQIPKTDAAVQVNVLIHKKGSQKGKVDAKKLRQRPRPSPAIAEKIAANAALEKEKRKEAYRKKTVSKIKAGTRPRQRPPPSLRPVAAKNEKDVMGFAWSHFNSHPFLGDGDGDEEPKEDKSSSDEDDEEVQIVEVKLTMKPNIQERCMTTTIPYYVADDDSNMEAEEAAPETPSVSAAAVEVPQWRENEVEGTERDEDAPTDPDDEDVSEASYNRRHGRHEQDEKRRKRWDSQRVREESYVEQLKRRIAERGQKQRSQKGGGTRKMPNPKGGICLPIPKAKIIGAAAGSSSATAVDGSSIATLFAADPSALEDNEGLTDIHGEILYVNVADDIPISIFGHLLPIVDKETFDLPWLAEEEEKKKEEDKSSGKKSKKAKSKH